MLSERYSLLLGPSPRMTSVMRLRLHSEEVEPVVAEVRRLIADRAHDEPTWWVGTSATPSDLVERLLALGFVPRTQPSWEPRCTAMALATAPRRSASVAVRRVESLDDYRRVLEIEWEAFGSPEEHRIEGRESAAAEFDAMFRDGSVIAYLAEVDSEAVGSAQAVPGDAGMLMIGGAVLPAARGQGVYGSLVRARWDDAVERGTPALVTQAGSMSCPILEQLGFVAVAEIAVLLDAEFQRSSGG